MSQENVEIVRRVYEVVNGGGEPPADWFLPDVKLDARGAAPDMGSFRDFEAAATVLRSYVETFEDFHIDLEEVIHADDECVVTAVRDGGRIRGSDAEVRNRFFHVFEFRGNKVAGWSTHTDRKQALEAAGLSE